jgi:hypothetical protein
MRSGCVVWARGQSLGLYAFSLISLTACSSNTDNQSLDDTFRSDSFQKPGLVLSEGSSESHSAQVLAKSSWQDFGAYAVKDSKLLISSTGQWSGGQKKIAVGNKTATLQYCDAEGCWGDRHLSPSDDDYMFEALDTLDLQALQQGLNWSYLDGSPYESRVQRIILSEDNVLVNKEESATTEMVGFAEGKVDGMRVCFASQNTLLGADQANVGVGQWSRRADQWQKTLDFWTEKQYRASLLNFGQAMIDLYRTATCDDPPTSADVLAIAETAALDDGGGAYSPYAWTGQEWVYEPSFFADVPENNYKQRCNSAGDIVLNYNYGEAHAKIQKNECSSAPLNSLVMKIVADNEPFEDVEPIHIGKLYESTALEISKTGRIYFRNNDTDAGISDNSGSLRVSVRLNKATAESQEQSAENE